MKKIFLIAAAGAWAVAVPLHAGEEVRLDFGTPGSPVEQGWIRASSAGSEGLPSFRWLAAPIESIDVPQADPLDPLSRDGVQFSSEKPL